MEIKVSIKTECNKCGKRISKVKTSPYHDPNSIMMWAIRKFFITPEEKYVTICCGSSFTYYH